MLVLGIETSCDETGLALLEFDDAGVVTVRGEVLASQVALHELYGGVVPELASREHMRNLPVLCEQLFNESGAALSDVGCIGVTTGPGLKGCLLIGVTFAQGVQSATGAALRGVNHIEAHILCGELHSPQLSPPYIALVVSGGHTEVIRVSGLGSYEILYRTLDDAAGEAFDKSANLLGLAYPGGPRLAALADTVSSSRFVLPKVAREMENFSFSGLKTAVMLLIRKNETLLKDDPSAAAEAAWAIQEAILDPLVRKTEAEVRLSGLPLVVCGGVSANTALRKRLHALFGDRVIFPPLKHCVDNGAMIAYAAGRYHREKRGFPPLTIKSRWPLDEIPSV